MTTNTLDDPSEFDVLIKLRPGEPHFTLAGRDPHAPILVREWATMERAIVKDVTNREEAEHRLRKATDAEFISWEMDIYRTGQDASAVQSGGTQSYSSYVLPPEAAKRDQDNRSRLAAARHLSEAAAQAQSAKELLDGMDDADLALLAVAVRDAAKLAAEKTRPQLPIALQPELDGMQ